MCDTIVALPNCTSDGRTLFGKNSDRPPNEAQVIRYVPRAQHDKGGILKCTYIGIPQAKETYAIFLSSPYWIWGAEMGANEHGVAIGNEAVYSKEQVPDTGLLGMDLLRLGLERAKTSRGALDVITSLLEKHGQGGIYEFGGVNKYHNSFLIADKSEAWVLETSNRRWVAEKVDSVRSISNGYTIHTHWDLSCRDLIEHAIRSGWTESKEDFDFTAAYEDETLRYITRCDDRLHCSTEYLQQMNGRIDFFNLAALLRSHPEGWTPWKQEVTPICRHAGPDDGFSVTGSQISDIDSESTHWFTGSSSPCMSIFWPFSFDMPHIYPGFDVGEKDYSDRSYWWRRERVNRSLALKFGAHGLTFPEIIRLQDDIYKTPVDRLDMKRIETAVQNHEKLNKGLAAKARFPPDIDSEYFEYWRMRNAEAGLPPD
ncbi:MAG: peptidase U34 [Candidatus Thorarchaeota archaeon]|nr:MAG: peptidase U34 [Candidatus Thorarchaeota archaeon]